MSRAAKQRKSDVEHYTWPDQVADALAERGSHVASGMWTPSGYFHVGNARPELISPALVAAAVDGKHLFFTDDFDDLDKVPKGFDSERFEEWLGKPLREVPSPVKGFDSWAEYFSHDVISAMDAFGMQPEVRSVYEEYQKGTYDEAIKIVLDKAGKVRDIWNKITGAAKPGGWLPVMVVCEKCGRSATTKPTKWDGKVHYECSRKRDYTEPCGHSGSVTPKKGAVKLPWRLNWPATWWIFGVTYETAGKDHFAAGGSVETGREFMRAVFEAEPPYQNRTEFLQIGGRKISGSAGGALSMSDWLEFAEPELLKYMYVSYQPSTVIEFDVHRKFLLLAQRFYEAERAYFGETVRSEKATKQLARQYRLAMSGFEIPKKRPFQLDYSLAAMLAQAMPKDRVTKALKGMGLAKSFTKFDEQRIQNRLELAENWVNKYVPEEKIEINKNPPTVSGKEAEAVRELADELGKKLSGKDLQSRIYEIARSHDIEPKSFFQLLYQILIGRESGPKMAPFILSLGRDKVTNILEKSLESG